MNDALRAQFPLLARRIDGKPVVYLDSAATALKPRAVLEAERAYSEQFTANVHRGRHALSQEASVAYDAARRRVARHVGGAADGVAFTRNTTESLNLVALGLGLAKTDVVLAPIGEHHSNLLPWMKAATLRFIEADPLEPLPPAKLDEAIAAHRPKVFTVSLASNVTGAINPVAELCKLARERGVLTVVDAAQGAPHLDVSLSALGCDYLAFSGHKLMGPTGIGVLAGSREALALLDPVFLGGGTVEKVGRDGYTLKKGVARFESGTPHISGALGLAAALDFLGSVGLDAVAAHEAMLADALEQGLAKLPGARVLMSRSKPRLAIASVAPLSTRVAADHLALGLSDGSQVMARSGYFCAQPAFEYWGLQGGALRLSAYVYNTREEIDRACEALGRLLERLVVTAPT